VRLLYLDCFAGVAGDMAAASLLDLIGEEAWSDLVEALGRLELPGCEVRIERVRKDGFAAVDFVTTPESGDPPRRHLADVERVISRAGLEPEVLRDALAMFRLIASAEARVHGLPEDRIHFHEVGAADSILDIVSISWAKQKLSPDRTICSSLPVGMGFVQCSHGHLPVPAPGALAILEGVPVYQGEFLGETVTPTGAAAAVTLSDSFGPLPACRILKVGYGAGKARRTHPNLMRAYLAETPETALEGVSPTEVVEVETTIDDMNPEAFAPLLDRLFEAGALDVTLTPVQMKKSRPGILVTVLAGTGDLHGISSILLIHTSTFGVRYSARHRFCLDRSSVMLETPFGPVAAKAGRLGEQVLKVVPEYEDCRKVALKAGVPYLEVYEAALAASRKR
jgi:uncharacterized protein (TIGR00299 family) protein